MRDCHLKHTRDRVVATCRHMPRLIPPSSLVHTGTITNPIKIRLLNLLLYDTLHTKSCIAYRRGADLRVLF